MPLTSLAAQPTGDATSAPALPHVEFRTQPDRYRHWRLAIDGDDRHARSWTSTSTAASARATSSSSTRTTSASTSSSPTRSSACASSIPRCRPWSSTSGNDGVLLGREHLHARRRRARVQGELLQVHQRDAPVSRTRRASPARPASRRVNGTASGGGYELALACDADHARRRRLVRGLASRGAAARRAAGHRRAHAARRQAQGAPRPGRRVLDHGRGRARPTRAGVGPGRRGRAAGAVGRRGARARRASSPRGRRRAPAPRGDRAGAAGEGTRRRAIDYPYVDRALDRGRARGRVTVRGPRRPSRRDDGGCDAWARSCWPLRVRELDDVLLDLRFNEPEIGVMVLRDRGDPARVLALDAMLLAQRGTTGSCARSCCYEARAQAPRQHRRSLFALVEPALLRRLAARARARGRPLYMLDGGRGRDEDREIAAARSSSDERGAAAHGQRAVPARRRASRRRRRAARALEQRAAAAAPRRPRARARHVRARRHRLGRRGPHRLRGARELRPTRSPAWRPTSASPAPRRSRRRSSAGSPPGRTGSSPAPTRRARDGALRLYGSRSGPSSTGTGSDPMTTAVDTTRRSRTTSTSRATSACSARSRRGSRSSSTGGSEMGPTASDAGRLPAHGDQRRPRRLGALRLREDARLPLGHLPRRADAGSARSASATHMGQPVWQQVPGEHRNNAAPPHRHAGRHRAGERRAAAQARRDRARASTTCATCSR